MPNWKYLRYEIQERWEQLSEKQQAIRQWINAKPRVMISITCVSVFILLVIVINLLIPDRVPRPERIEKAWFYDLNTGKLFIAKSDKLSPIKAPSGPLPNGEPAGVKAYVFSFSEEPNESNRFIGFLEKFTPEGKEYMSSFRKSKGDVTKESIRRLTKSRFIRKVTDEQWYTADSNEAGTILKEVFQPNQNGETARYCQPE